MRGAPLLGLPLTLLTHGEMFLLKTSQHNFDSDTAQLKGCNTVYELDKMLHIYICVQPVLWK